MVKRGEEVADLRPALRSLLVRLLRQPARVLRSRLRVASGMPEGMDLGAADAGQIAAACSRTWMANLARWISPIWPARSSPPDLNQLENMIRRGGRAGRDRSGSRTSCRWASSAGGRSSRWACRRGATDRAAQDLADHARSRRGMSPEQIEALREPHRRPHRRRMRKSVRSFTERELQKQNHDYMEKFRRETLLEKSFYHLTEEEIRKMREVSRAARAARSRTSSPMRKPPASRRASWISTRPCASNMSHGAIALRARLQAAEEGSPEAGDPHRRVLLGGERLALHAAVRLHAAGVLHQDPGLRVRGRAR